MTHPNFQTNGASLEDCHTNFFALMDVCGIRWRRLSTESSAGFSGAGGGVVGGGADPLDDPVLLSFAKCLAADILCVWRRVPQPAQRSADPPTPAALAHSRFGEHPPAPTTHPPLCQQLVSPTAKKELWIFLCGSEPDLNNVIGPELTEVEQGSWENGLSYECRTLLFKAIHNRIERSLLSREYVRLGKWFIQPHDAQDKQVKCPHSLAFSFFIHGESTVCACVDVREPPPVRRLSHRHLLVAQGSQSGLQVILGPYGQSGILTGQTFKDSDQAVQKLLEEWRQYYPVDPKLGCTGSGGNGAGASGNNNNNNGGGNNGGSNARSGAASDGCQDESAVLPALVEVLVGGVRLKYPSCYVLVTDVDDMCGAMSGGGIQRTTLLAVPASHGGCKSSANSGNSGGSSIPLTPPSSPCDPSQLSGCDKLSGVVGGGGGCPAYGQSSGGGQPTCLGSLACAGVGFAPWDRPSRRTVSHVCQDSLNAVPSGTSGHVTPTSATPTTSVATILTNSSTISTTAAATTTAAASTTSGSAAAASSINGEEEGGTGGAEGNWEFVDPTLKVNCCCSKCKKARQGSAGGGTSVGSGKKGDKTEKGGTAPRHQRSLTPFHRRSPPISEDVAVFDSDAINRHLVSAGATYGSSVAAASFKGATPGGVRSATPSGVPQLRTSSALEPPTSVGSSDSAAPSPLMPSHSQPASVSQADATMPTLSPHPPASKECAMDSSSAMDDQPMSVDYHDPPASNDSAVAHTPAGGPKSTASTMDQSQACSPFPNHNSNCPADGGSVKQSGESCSWPPGGGGGGQQPPPTAAAAPSSAATTPTNNHLQASSATGPSAAHRTTLSGGHHHHQHHGEPPHLPPPLKRPLLPTSSYEDLEDDEPTVESLYDYSSLNAWLQHPVKRFKAESGAVAPNYRRGSVGECPSSGVPSPAACSASASSAPYIKKEPMTPQMKTEPSDVASPKPTADPYEFVDDITTTVSMAGFKSKNETNCKEDEKYGVAGAPCKDPQQPSSQQAQPPSNAASAATSPAPAVAGADGAAAPTENGGGDLDSPPTPKTQPAPVSLLNEKDLVVTYEDLDQLFDTSGDDTNDDAAPSPPGSVRALGSVDDGTPGKTKQTCGIGILGATELSRMFPTPPSLEQASPCGPAGVCDPASIEGNDVSFNSLRDRSDMYPGYGSPCDEATMDWSYVFKLPPVAKFVGSVKYAPLVNLPSLTLPPIALPAQCVYKPSWHHPQPIVVDKLMPPSHVSALSSVESMERLHEGGGGGGSSVGGRSMEPSPATHLGSVEPRMPHSLELLQSPASNASSYLNRHLHSVEQPDTSGGGGSGAVHTGSGGALAVPGGQVGEAHSLLVNLALSDSLVNLFKDHNFNSCTMCVCHMNVRGSDAGTYLPDSLLPVVGSDDAPSYKCTCGFSAVVNRRHGHRAGLFYEDELEITGLRNEELDRRKPPLLALTPGRDTGGLLGTPGLKDALDPSPPYLVELLKVQYTTLASSSCNLFYKTLLAYHQVVRLGSPHAYHVNPQPIRRHQPALTSSGAAAGGGGGGSSSSSGGAGGSASSALHGGSSAGSSGTGGTKLASADSIMATISAVAAGSCSAGQRQRGSSPVPPSTSNAAAVSSSSSSLSLALPSAQYGHTAASTMEMLDGCEVTFAALEQCRQAAALESGLSSTAVALSCLDETQKHTLLHKWPFLAAKLPSNNQELVRLLRTLQPLLQEAIHKKHISQFWEATTTATYNVSGPLTWRQFLKLAGRSTEDQCEPQPIPSLLVGYDKDWLALSPFAIKYWEKLLLEPYTLSRDVAYVVVAPDNDFILGCVKTFFKELSGTYEVCRLGRHSPITKVLRDGILRVGKKAAKSLADQPVDDWFNLIGDSAVACKLKLYAQVCRHHLAPHLATQPMDASLLEPLRAAPEKMVPAASPMPPLTPETSSTTGGSGDKERAPTPKPPSSATQDSASAASSQDSSEPGVGGPKEGPVSGSGQLGGTTDLDADENAQPPALVIYIVDPFTYCIDNPETHRLASIGLLRCYAQMLRYLPEAMQNNVNLQIIPLESIVEQTTNEEKCKHTDKLKSLAFSVFAQCRRTIIHQSTVKSLTGFGPAAAAETFLKVKDERNLAPYRMYSPPYILAPMKDKQTQLTESFGDHQEKATVLFCTYCLSEDQRWLLASCTDDRGEILETCVINVEIPNRHRRKKASAQKIGLQKLMDWILGVMSAAVMPWRLVVGRLGRLGHGELKCWSNLLSKKTLLRACKLLKEMCKQCQYMNGQDTPCILSACLVSLEGDSALRVMPDQFTPDEFSGSSCNNYDLSTPQDASCTHILVFPTSATTQPPTVVGYQQDPIDALGPNFQEEDILSALDEEGHNMTEINAIFNWTEGSPGSPGMGSPRQQNSRPCSPGMGMSGRQSPFQNGGFSRGVDDLTSDPQEEAPQLLQQPLALGYYVSTAKTGPLPKWFWTPCAHLENVCPAFLRSALHIHSPTIQSSDDLFQQQSHLHSYHPLDSNLTTDVLRHVLEGYNALSWLAVDPVTHDRRSCLPVHVQVLMQMYYAMAALI